MMRIRNKIIAFSVSVFISVNTFGQIDSVLKYKNDLFVLLTKKPFVKELKKHTPIFKRKLCKDTSNFFMSKYTTYENMDSISDKGFLAEFDMKKNKKIYFLVIFGDNSMLNKDPNFISGTIYYLFKHKKYINWWEIKKGLRYSTFTDFLFSIKKDSIIFSTPYK